MIFWEANAKEKHDEGLTVSFYVYKDNPKYNSKRKKSNKNFPYFEQEYIHFRITGEYVYAEHNSPNTWRKLGEVFQINVFDKEEYENKANEFITENVIWEKDLYFGEKRRRAY